MDEIQNYIDAIPEDKKGAVPIYRKLSRQFIKSKVLRQTYPQNPSFKIFIENELKVKIPLNTEGS